MYLITGFHLSSVTLNNGILFNGITLELRQLKIEIRSVRFWLWGNSRMIIVDGLNLTKIQTEDKKQKEKKTDDSIINNNKDRDDSNIINNNINKRTNSSNRRTLRKRTSTSSSASGTSLSTAGVIPLPELSPIPEDELEIERVDKLMVFPKNYFGRIVVRFLVRHIPKVDIEFRHTFVHTSDKHTSGLDYLRLTLQSRYSKRYTEKIKLQFDVLFNNFSQTLSNTNEVDDDNKDQFKKSPISISTFRFHQTFLIDLTSGQLDNIKLKMFVNEPRINVFAITKACLSIFCDSVEDEVLETSSKNNTASNTRERQKRLLKKLSNIHTKIHSALNEVSIHAENLIFNDIPFASMAHNQNFEEYFNRETPLSCLDLQVKSVSFNFTVIEMHSAGFDVLFDQNKDFPFHSTLSFQLLKLNFSTLSKMDTGVLGKSSDEILNIPNFSFTHKGNIFDHLVRGRGFKDCVLEFYSSASNPVLDLTTVQVSEIFYNLVLLRKLLQLQKLRNLQKNEDSTAPNYQFTEEGCEVEDEDEDNTRVEDSPKSQSPEPEEEPQGVYLQERLFQLLNDYYPRLDTNFVIEQPRFIIRHHNPGTNKIQLLNFSYSMLDFRLLTTASRNYDSKCHVLHPSVTYHGKYISQVATDNQDSIKTEIVLMKSIMLHLEILKNLRVKSHLDVNDFVTDASNIDVLLGVHTVLKDITRIVEQDLNIGVLNLSLNSQIDTIRYNVIRKSAMSLSRKTSSLEDRIFKYLPSWIIEAQFNLSSLTIILGSRSVVIPKDLLHSTEGSGLEDDYLTDSHKLRNLRMKCDNISISLGNLFKNESDLGDSDSFYQSTSSTASLETLTSFVDKSTYWSLGASFSNLTTSTLTELEGKPHKYNSLTTMPSTKIKVSAIRDISGEKNLKLDVNIDNIKVNYDKYKLFTVLGAIYVLREFVIMPIRMVKTKLKKDLVQFSSVGLTPMTRRTRSIKDLLQFQFHLSSLDVILKLNEDHNFRVQAFTTSLLVQSGMVVVDNHFIRALTDSPFSKGNWCRIVCVDSLKLRVDDPLADHKVSVDTDNIRFTQPYGFVAHRLFDNISANFKIAKYLVKCLKEESNKRAEVIYPKEMKVKELPKTNIKSNRVSFNMEDDPFESELNMIYQLGLLEQRKRLEQYSLFATKARDRAGLPYAKKLYNLRQNISRSWIRKVNIFKGKLENEISLNRKYLYGNEANLDRSFHENFQPYPLEAPLLLVKMEQFDLTISKFDRDCSSFLYEMGQGVPKDTRYSLNLQLHLNLKLKELRMHLRDYPIPLVHVPQSRDKTVPSLTMTGYLVIAEDLITSIENVRSSIVPLTPHSITQANQKYHFVEIQKSLSSVKVYTDLECNFNSEYPTRFMWGQSYQFAIQQFMLNFDQFSKPPVDPSVKLGFWDKLRLVLHGKCHFLAKKNLEIAFKGSRDPYNLFDMGNGFVLSFRKNVVWKINENNDLNKFFDITSEKLSFYIPNYLSAPLLAWTRDSSKAIYLPDSNKFITSCHGYNLDELSSSPSSKEYRHYVFDKNVVSLSGGVHFTVGFLLERKDKLGKRTQELRHHYDLRLFNPKYTTEGHDSYKGFRSDYIHMAISLVANNDSSYNTIHLTPGTFRHFFHWWSLFASNLMLPVRKGKMFGVKKKPMKFSQHLFTNKYLFNLKLLFLTHMYREETMGPDTSDLVQCVGLRAKIDHFLVDLHLRKEPRIVVHESLARNDKISKMNFNVGEVHLSKIDLRVIQCGFVNDLYNTEKAYNDKESSYNIFDGDKRWFDLEDYKECFYASLSNCARKFDVYPLLYSKKFTYNRDTQTDNIDIGKYQVFGNEHNHECFLNSQNIYQPQIEVLEDRIRQLEKQVEHNERKKESTKYLTDRIEFLHNEISHTKRSWKVEKRKALVCSLSTESNENFHNKFILVGMNLKWNLDSRNCFLRYIHFVKLLQSLKKFMSYDAISTLQELIDTSDRLSSDNRSFISNLIEKIKTEDHTHEENPRGLHKFDELLRKHSVNESVTEDYFIEIISPQIQLQSDDYPDSLVVIAAPSIKAKLVSVVDKASSSLVLHPKELTNRIGVMLNDAEIFVLDKDILVADKIILDHNTYGSTSNWPPWLAIEVCKSGKWAKEDNLLVENMLMMVLHEQSKPLGTTLTRINDLELLNDDPNSASDDITRHIASGSTGAVDKFSVEIPKLVITSTSEQYFTLYMIVFSLFFYSEPMSKNLSNRLEALKFSVDFQDLSSLHDRLVTLHNNYMMMYFLNRNYSFRQGRMSNEDLNNDLILNLEREEVLAEIYLMLKTLLTGDNTQEGSNDSKAFWDIRADQIVLHMLENDRTPILDLELTHGKYRRTVYENGSDVNRIEIGMLKGYNLLPEAVYPSFLEPYVEEDHRKLQKNDRYEDRSSKQESKSARGSLMTVDWTMNRSVGGIKIIEKLDITSKPLSIRLDEHTGEKLTSFIFRTDEEHTVRDSPLLKMKAASSLLDDKGRENSPDIVQGQQRSVTFLDTALDESSGSANLSNLRNRDRVSTRLTESFNSDNDSEQQDQIVEMIDRSKKYISIVSLSVNPLSLMISIKLDSGILRLLNVEDLLIDIPEFVIERRVVSFLEVSKMLEKLVIRTLLHHSGRVLKNKLSVKKKKLKKILNPIRSLHHSITD